MSRSTLNNPIIGNASASEKWDKRFWHRSYRRACKMLIDLGDFDGLHDKSHLDHSDPWLMQKDGKRYLQSPDHKLLRK